MVEAVNVYERLGLSPAALFKPQLGLGGTHPPEQQAGQRQSIYEMRSYMLHPGYGVVPKLMDAFGEGCDEEGGDVACRHGSAMAKGGGGGRCLPPPIWVACKSLHTHPATQRPTPHRTLHHLPLVSLIPSGCLTSWQPTRRVRWCCWGTATWAWATTWSSCGDIPPQAPASGGRSLSVAWVGEGA